MGVERAHAGVDFAAVVSEEAVRAPFDEEEVRISKREYIALKARASFYEAQHARATRRIEHS